MPKPKTDKTILSILEMYDLAYNKTSWHGPNLRGSLRGLKLPILLYRPQPKRHNIWEIALHCAYWKYAVRRRITCAKKGGFIRKPSNFPKIPITPTVKDWKIDLALLEKTHLELRVEIENFPVGRLKKKPQGSTTTFIETLYGIASHDLYHAGQIQLIKRMRA